MRKYDYNRNYFDKKSDDCGNIRYYFRYHGEQIEVPKEVYDVCEKSYQKIKNDYKRDATKLVVYYENHDYGTSFFVFNDKIISLVDSICINDSLKVIKETINMLPEQDFIIAKCIYIDGLSERETAKYLRKSHSTIHYRKLKINMYLQKVIIDFMYSKLDLK